MKSSVKKSLAVLLAMLLIVSFAACGGKDEGGNTGNNEPKSDLVTFTSDCGFSMQLPKGYTEEAMEGYAVFLYTDNYAMSVTKEDFAVLEQYGLGNADTTLEEYIAIIEEGNGIEFGTDSCGNPGVNYTSDVDGETYYYYTTARKGSDAFFLVSIFCFDEDSAEYAPKFEQWADTIEVK